MRRIFPLIASILLGVVLISCHPQKTSDLASAKASNTDSLQHEAEFASLDGKTLLGRLFDNPIFDSTGAAIWSPNYYERQNLSVSYDGKCHTNIDTVMYFTDRNKRQCAAVILTMYNYRKGGFLKSDSAKVDVGDCHFCGVPIGVALLAQEPGDSTWQLYKFSKAFASLGYFGRYRTGRQDAGTISLKTIGDPWTCLSLREGVGGNMGVFTGGETLYSIEEFQISGFPNGILSPVFSYNYYFENESDGTDALREKYDGVMKLIKRSEDYYDIDLVTTTFRGKVTTEHYRYSDEYNQYILKK